MFTANEKGNTTKWLSKHDQEEIADYVEIYTWWQENEGNYKLNDFTKMIVKHAIEAAYSKGLAEFYFHEDTNFDLPKMFDMKRKPKLK